MKMNYIRMGIISYSIQGFCSGNALYMGEFYLATALFISGAMTAIVVGFMEVSK